MNTEDEAGCGRMTPRWEELHARGRSQFVDDLPFTAMRGFGGPQACFVLEAAIRRAARQTGLSAERIQALSLLSDGDPFPYGMPTVRCRARECWRMAHEHFAVDRWRQRVTRYNARHPLSKKGLSVTPLCFGISFTHLPLNQGYALVHLYLDGSVGFTTGAVEMGQGVTARLRLVVAHALGIGQPRVRAESTNTTRVASREQPGADARSRPDRGGGGPGHRLDDQRGAVLRRSGASAQ